MSLKTPVKSMKKMMYAWLTVATLAFGTYCFGIDGLANGIAFPAGEAVAKKIEGKRISLDEICRQTMSGVAMTPVFQYGWEKMEKYIPVERLSNVYKENSLSETANYFWKHAPDYAVRTAAIGGAFLPSVVAVNQSIDHVLEKKSLNGIYTNLKNNWLSATKKVIKQVAPLVALNTFLVPQGLNIAVGSVNSAIYRVASALGSKASYRKKEHAFYAPAYQRTATAH